MTEPAPENPNLPRATNELFLNTLYSYKNQFNASLFWANVSAALGVPVTIAAAVAAALAYANHGGSPAALLALITAAGKGLEQFLQPAEKAAKHKAWGSGYQTLNSDVKDFYRLDLNDASHDREWVRARYDELQSRRNGLNTGSGLVPTWAFRRTKKNLSAEAEYTEAELRLIEE